MVATLQTQTGTEAGIDRYLIFLQFMEGEKGKIFGIALELQTYPGVTQCYVLNGTHQILCIVDLTAKDIPEFYKHAKSSYRLKDLLNMFEYDSYSKSSKASPMSCVLLGVENGTVYDVAEKIMKLEGVLTVILTSSPYDLLVMSSENSDSLYKKVKKLSVYGWPYKILNKAP